MDVSVHVRIWGMRRLFADLDGIRMHYEVSGEGETVMLIGGFGVDTRFWEPTVAELEGFRVITYDNRGVGSTEYAGGFSIRDLAEDAASLLGFLGEGPVHVIGWSMGTQIAIELAAHHPEMVSTLTLVSPFVRLPSRARYLLGTLTSMAADGSASTDCLAIAVNAMCFPESVFRHLEHRGESMQIPEETQDPKGLMDQVKAMDDDVGGHLDDLDLPVLVVHGAQDIMVEPDEGVRVASGIRGCRLLLLDSYGHSVPFEAYRAEFLDLIGQTGPASIRNRRDRG